MHPPSRRTILVAAGSTAFVAAMSGCDTDFGSAHNGPRAPRQVATATPASMCWVLSSGGPRGFAHVGVLKALTELKLRPQMVVGASVGALVGCLYAAGLPVSRIERLALDMGPSTFIRPNLLSGPWLSAAALPAWLNELVGDKPIEAFDIRFAAVAIDQVTRQPCAFNQGDAGAAVQAASAIEERLAPVQIRGRHYVDADLVTPLPVRMARALGARRVLAVDASAHEDKAPPGTERWRAGDRRKRELTAADAQLADFTLHPDFGYFAGLSPEYRAMAIREGYEQTMAHADRLRSLHASAAAT